MNPKLSILIATLGRRNEKFHGLLNQLLPQLDDTLGEVEVVAYWNNGEKSIGEIRQALLREAKGDYVCFVDDDDMIADDYCIQILNALGKDYVGFKVQLYNDGKRMPVSYHSLKYEKWSQDWEGYYRNVTHLNPIRREIALKGKFSRDGAGEDHSWAEMVAPYTKTENFIDKVLYFYYHNYEDSSFGPDNRPKPTKEFTRPVVNYKHFRYHPNSNLTSRETK